MSTKMKSALVCLAVVLLAHISNGKLNQKMKRRWKNSDQKRGDSQHKMYYQ